jgi:glutaconate CoA-transferase subunit A
VEEILPSGTLRERRDHLLLPGFRVTTISLEPWGAHPSYVQGRYDRDQLFYLEWDRLSRDPLEAAAWLERFVIAVPDRDAYIQLWDPERLLALRRSAGHG